MKHPVRWIFERLGWVRTEEQARQRYAAADHAIEEALKEIRMARRRRGLADEVNSYRSRGTHP